MASGVTVEYSSGSLWQFTFMPNALSGQIRYVMYGTALGALATQDFSWDFLDSTNAATLEEDGDGIIPAGSGTCDETPTILWDQPGSDTPYLYRWVCRLGGSSGTVVASGVTVNVTRVELPELDPGTYHFSLIATGTSGVDVDITPLRFAVLNCRFLRDPLVVTLDAFDIEPVASSEEDYIRYLPQWMSLHGTVNAPPSGALLFRFFQSPLRDFRTLQKNIQETLDQASILNVPARLPRQSWHMQSRFTDRDPLTVTYSASGEADSVRRTGSVFEFLTADDPVYLIGERGHMLFRNMARRVVTVAPVSGSTGATGQLLQYLSHQYRIPHEPNGIVRDTDVLFSYQGVQYRIKAGASGVDPDQSTIQLPESISGTITFSYQSRTLAPVVQVSVSGNPSLPIDLHDLWNRFDELGLVVGLQRRTNEDNVRFRERILSRFLSRLGVTPHSVAQHISQDLTLTTVLSWDGRRSLDFPASGIHAVSYFNVEGLPETVSVQEELVRAGSDYQLYTSAKSDWLPGYLIFVNGVLASRNRYPNLVVSGNIVHFGTPVSGVVAALYQYNNYVLTRTGQNNISLVTPVDGNAVSGTYTAVLTRNVKVFTASDPDFIDDRLLNADGTPNAYFFELAARLLEGSPIHVGRARWGEGSYWLFESNDKPLTEHIPVVFDVIAGN